MAETCWSVLLALLTNTPVPTMLDSVADYPRWLVALCVMIVLAAVIWIALKILKWTLWLLLFAVLIIGVGTALWLVLR